MKKFVYHFKPQAMSGNILFPLNQLKTSLPEIYDSQVKKYEGREILLEKKIFSLNCLWNDVIHLSPINPQIILDVWAKEKLEQFTRVKRPIEVFKIPIEMLDESKMIYFQSFNYDFNNRDPLLDKFWTFNKNEYAEQFQVDPKQIEIWHNNFKEGRKSFWYSHTMHILSKQSIDTRECELIICGA